MINNSININKVNNHLSPKENLKSDHQQLYQYPDFPKLAEKLSVIRTDRHENLVRPKNICRSEKKVPKNSLSHA